MSQTLLAPFRETLEGIKSSEFSFTDVVAKYISSINNQKHLNAFLEVFEDDAISFSKIVDEKIKNNSAGKLGGMVIAIKDVINIKDKRTTCGSKILENFIAPYDATVIERLKKSDATLIGKTNMDEFAMGSSNENSAYGAVLHPLDNSRVPGGSSGGSAVAVAAKMAMTSLGTDTGGSIRQPAGFCGIFGMKPTYGRVSRYGLVAFASSFDQIGVFSSTPKDLASVLEVISGHDEKDSTSSKIEVGEYLKNINPDVKGLKIGLPKEYFHKDLPKEINDLISEKINFLKSKGAKFVEVTLPHSDYTIATYYILATAEASSNLARYDGARYGYRSKNSNSLTQMYEASRSEGFGSEVKARIMLGTYVLSSGYYDAYYKKAQKVRRLIQNDFLEAYKQVDCILTPITPSTAFKIGEKTDEPLQMYLSDVFTVSANLAGIPGINIPIGFDKNNLPVGMQILGKHFDEQILLNVAECCFKN
ncbi:MAG: Asp-tRNA(Asn)/Glu-tRNA(Gln) amidotransferase subunit GatA [Bacteroidota bacterium]